MSRPPRSRAAALVLTAVVLPASLAAQSSRYDSYLRRTYPELRKVTVPQLLADAERAGLLRSVADRIDLKLALRRARGKGGRWVSPQVLLDRPTRPVVAVAEAAITETEYNNGLDYADDATGQTTASGDNGAPDDRSDFWRITSAGEVWTFEVVPAGPAPMQDSTLRVFSATGQCIAMNDDNGSSLFSRVATHLPAGPYFVEVGRYDVTEGGGYDLLIGTHPGSGGGAISVGSGTLTNVPLHAVHTLGIPDARVRLQVATLGGGDLALVIQAADGTVVFHNDDSSVGTDPGAEITLPMGVYSITVYEVTGAPGFYDLTYTVTAATIPDLCATGPATGTIGGDESLDVYKVDLSGAAQTLQLSASPSGGGGAVSDTMIDLYDAEFRLIALNDDDAATLYSSMQLELPAAVYYVGVRQYPGSGGGTYQVAATCSPGFAPGTIGWGRTIGGFLGNGTGETRTLDTCTTVSAGVFLDSFDGVSVLSPSGQALSGRMSDYNNTETPFWTASQQVYVLTWEPYHGSTTSYNLRLDPPLSCSSGALQSHGKPGDVAFLIASNGVVPGIGIVGTLQGELCLSLGGIVPLVGVPVPPSGTLTWTTPCPSAPGWFLQDALVFGPAWPAQPGGALGRWRNVLPLK